jgi:hypothetical protein
VGLDFLGGDLAGVAGVSKAGFAPPRTIVC